LCTNKIYDRLYCMLRDITVATLFSPDLFFGDECLVALLNTLALSCLPIGQNFLFSLFHALLELVQRREIRVFDAIRAIRVADKRRRAGRRRRIETILAILKGKLC